MQWVVGVSLVGGLSIALIRQRCAFANLPAIAPVMATAGASAGAPSPPPPPTLTGPPSFTGSPEQTTLRVQWPAIAQAATAREILFEVEMGKDSAAFALVYSGPKTEAALEGLDPGTLYKFRVSRVTARISLTKVSKRKEAPPPPPPPPPHAPPPLHSTVYICICICISLTVASGSPPLQQVRALADGKPGPYQAVIEGRTLAASPGPPKARSNHHHHHRSNHTPP